MRLPRFRIQTLMIAVAVVAITIYGGKLRGRRLRYLKRAGHHAQLAKDYANNSERFTDLATIIGERISTKSSAAADLPPMADVLAQAQHSAHLRDFHRELEAKYRRGASRPWSEPPPDPPDPD